MKLKTKLFAALITATLTLGTFTSSVSATNTSAYSYSTSTATSSVPTLSITKDSFINYTYGRLNFKNKFIRLYDFSSEMYTGIGNRTSSYTYYEMYRGIHAYVNNNKLYYEVYNNARQKVTVNKATLISDTSKRIIKTAPVNKYTVLDTSKYANGLYKIEVNITYNSNQKETPFMYFYVNNGKTYLCSYATMNQNRADAFISRRKLTQKLIKEAGVTPENSTGISNLCYPWHPEIGRNDVANWAALSNTIVKSEWSDGLKVFAFHEWMTKNLAYDYYKVDKLKTRRAAYYKDYSGKHDTYTTRTGVCFDFTNILAIMCRNHGIPAVSIDSPTHTWNLVYLNGRWVEIDMTYDVRRSVYGADVTRVSNADSIFGYSGFGTYQVNNNVADSVNEWLFTYDKAKGRKS